MKVIGGTYRETCVVPYWEQIFGSGGRSALALAGLSPGTQLHTYACRHWSDDVRVTMGSVGIDAHITEIEEDLVFEYWHPLSKHNIPEIQSKKAPLVAKGDVVLGFGMLEGSMAVTADRLIFDPQSANVGDFNLTGSRFKSLAYVLKDTDLPRGRDQDERDAANRLMQSGGEIVLLRDTIGGARIYVGDAQPITVPAYMSNSWFKIGAGDVFASVFAYFWGEMNRNAIEAADLACRAVAYFNDGGRLPIPNEVELKQLTPVDPGLRPSEILLSGPCTTMPQIWLLEEAYLNLKYRFGAKVFSPFHEYEEPRRSSRQVLDRIQKCSALFAIADGRPLEANFHVGFAVANKIPVVMLAESMADGDATMFTGTRCEVVNDFASAVYRAYLASLRVDKQASI